MKINIQQISEFKIFIILVFFAFNTSIAFSQKIDSLLIGNGGGFTGQISIYSISKYSIKKGKGYPVIYSSETSYNRKYFKNISTKAKQAYNTTKGFSHPYNIYKFIEIYSNGKPAKYTWGDPNFKVPDNIENLYNQTMSIINSLNLNQK